MNEQSEPISRSDAQMVARAVRMQWELPPALAQELPTKLAAMVDHEDPRIAIRASETLLKMNDQNGPTTEADKPDVRIVIYDADNPPPVETDGPPGSVRICIPDNGRG